LAIDKTLTQIELNQMLNKKQDENNAIVSISSGAGGTESMDWTKMLLRMYLKWCENKGYKTQIAEMQSGEGAGIKSVTFIVNGKFAYGYLKAEAGIHRLVRISPFDFNQRRHTSFAAVFVIPELDDEIKLNIKEKDLKIECFRAGGHGGQHVNTTDSAVRITHIPTGISVQCQNERSQHQNKATAMKVLYARLYEHERIKQEKWKEKEFHSQKKEIAWGSQIRSYILTPYKMVKDHRTGIESSQVEKVLDGELDEFIYGYLLSFNQQKV
jgi:peptide chain release factor 2